MEVSKQINGFSVIYVCAVRLLKTKRDDVGIPILPSYDDQLRVIIVGEAGVGKYHVLRSLMWSAFQDEWADSTVVTSYQGRPVSKEIPLFVE
jgi:hypothetical protein